jgi:Domain of unknown function (DUF4160)
MFFNDHPPPYFHARYGEFEATMAIETLEVIEGELPSRALKLVREMGDDAYRGTAGKLAALSDECDPDEN